MNTTLGEAKAAARRSQDAQDYPRALRAYDAILSAVPLDYEVRFKIADVLAKLGLAEAAAEVYRAVALHDIRTGHPLPAIVACQALDALGRSPRDLLTLLAQTYASGSPHLARFATRQAPVDPSTTVTLLDAEASEPFDVLAERARCRALELPRMVYQQQFHPLPFFSELGPQPFLAAVMSLKTHRLVDGDLVVRQGDPGTALYLVAAGEVRVFSIGPGGQEKAIARLHENTLFGEMALITNQPRSASVAAAGEADIIEVSREALALVTAQLPAIKEVLDRFTRERLIKNLLARSPLFTPFSQSQQMDLLRRFKGHEVEPGVEVIREGEAGPGLFVVLTGELEVTQQGAGAAPLTIARLQGGDIFGEMSLVSGQPTSATVRAKTRASLLFLGRAYVERLAAAIPAVRDYFESVAVQRARDNTVRLAHIGVPAEPLDLEDSDLILL